MAFTKKTYEDIVNDILSQITRGIVHESHVYEPNQTKFKLRNSPVKEIVKITGTSNGSVYTFERGVDYRLSGDMLEWLSGGNIPDERTRFSVNYEIAGSSSISDVNPGSVARTLVESISREIEFLYSKLNHVYLSAFIDTAAGSALDLTVSLVGIERKEAEPAAGTVTFGRNSEPDEISIEQEAHVYNGRDTYSLNRTPIKNILQVEGTMVEEAVIFEPNTDYIVVGNVIEWQGEGKKPDPQSTFFVDYSVYEQVTAPAGTRVSTYSSRSEEAKVFETLEERALEGTPQGRWEADIPVRAVEPGVKGNVYAGTIIVMPQPLAGVEYVINRGDILTGVDPETDEDLRERARHALEVAGKATLVSLESAIKGLEGVNSVLVVDMPDDVAGLVKVVVQGGDREEIERVIDETRAAGIRVEFDEPRIVDIDVNINLSIRPWVSASDVQDGVESWIRDYLSSLEIGDDVVFNRVLKTAFDVKGVYDIKELSITASSEGKETLTSIKENVEISSEEMALARDVKVSITVLE